MKLKGIIAVVIVVLSAVFIFYIFFARGGTSGNQETHDGIGSHEENVGELSDARTPPPGWEEYRNDVYRFSLFYPEKLNVVGYYEGQGATTVTFEGNDARQGFQVFIIPYTEEQVTEERFAQDVPSGVRKNLVDIFVDGAVGAAFYSEHAALGETREVWFIRNYFLYEVTTLKPHEEILDTIIESWKFI